MVIEQSKLDSLSSLPEQSRRDFLKAGARLAVLMGLGSAAANAMAEGLERVASGQVSVLWLQGQSCSGCSVSLLNSDAPTPAQLLTEYFSLLFHSTLSTATGDVGMSIIGKTVETGGFYLAVEGTVPGMEHACMLGGRPFGQTLAEAASKAKAVLAVGTCACFGGIPAAENNPTQAMSVPAFFKSKGITTPTVLVPGCPAHPDWLVGTLVHLIKYGVPPLDELGRPKAFFKRPLHDQCPRFADYERERFAKSLSDEGCLFRLGCLGPNTHADCALRQWNAGVNTCVRANAPCIGCASEEFAAKASVPFYTKGLPGVKEGESI